MLGVCNGLEEWVDKFIDDEFWDEFDNSKWKIDASLSHEEVRDKLVDQINSSVAGTATTFEMFA